MILAIDTSGLSCGVALWSKNLQVARIEADSFRHNEILLQLITDLFYNNGVTHKQLAAIVSSEGPGSFTGLRVGMAIAKGLCYAWNLPFIAVPTMDGLAITVPDQFDSVLTVIPARADEVYWATYDRKDRGDWIAAQAVQVDDVHDLHSLCPDNYYIIGEGWSKHRMTLEDTFGDRILNHTLHEPPAELVTGIARIGLERSVKHIYNELMESDPAYCFPFPRR